MQGNCPRPSGRLCQRKKKESKQKDPEQAVYQDCPLMRALGCKLPKVVISKGMLNMNSISMQNRVCEKQQNLTKRDIPSDVNHCFQSYGQPCKLLKHIDLQYFKIQLCPSTEKHEPKQCPYYHDHTDRRRQPKLKIESRRPEQIYGNEMCPHLQDSEGCPLMEECHNSHNVVEQIYGSSKYKTKFCKYYPDKITECEYGIFCPCAHSEDDIKCELLENYEQDGDFYMFYYKTVCCPYFFIQHDQSVCPYAHGMSEWRRRVTQSYYEPIPCKQQLQVVDSCKHRCPDGSNCQCAHNEYEINYHPMMYKTRVCPGRATCQKGSCSYFHIEEDRRQQLSSQYTKRKVDVSILYRIFKIVPRNRIIQNTFKERVQRQTPCNEEQQQQPKQWDCPFTTKKLQQ